MACFPLLLVEGNKNMFRSKPHCLCRRKMSNPRRSNRVKAVGPNFSAPKVAHKHNFYIYTLSTEKNIKTLWNVATQPERQANSCLLNYFESLSNEKMLPNVWLYNANSTVYEPQVSPWTLPQPPESDSGQKIGWGHGNESCLELQVWPTITYNLGVGNIGPLT